MADDVYLAVPLDDEEAEAVNEAVGVSVQVFAVETDRDGLDKDDECVTTLYVGDRERAMTLALEILEQVRDKPGEAVEIRLSARVKIDEFQCERLTEDEARAVHARYLARMEEL